MKRAGRRCTEMGLGDDGDGGIVDLNDADWRVARVTRATGNGGMWDRGGNVWGMDSR